ncbi:MAG: helix-turn-helix domain-containing protein [Chloroflexota bacterium]|nr:helix-turn-helix domain-containing protein [Chloroflexota bacterium]
MEVIPMTSKNLAKQQKETQGVSDQLLSQKERAACLRIAEGASPHAQRAQALLAIDEGVSQPAAAQRTGQTLGQVRYWLGRFRKERLVIFPEDVLDQKQPEPISGPVLSEIEPGATRAILERPAGGDAAPAAALAATVVVVKKPKKKSKKKAKKPDKKAKKKTGKGKGSQKTGKKKSKKGSGGKKPKKKKKKG